MFSLRAAARAAPRMTSRLASSPITKTAFRPALQTAIRSQLPRTFTTTFRLRDDAAQELAAKLSSEIAIESEDNSTSASSNDNIQAFLSQNPHWEVSDPKDSQEVLLTRQYEDETITVAFSIADFNNPMLDGEGQEELDEGLMDDEDVSGGLESAQSGGANTKGAINQGRTGGGNFKVAPEDSIAPADREEFRNPEDEEVGEGEEAFPASVQVLVQRKNKGALRISLIADNGMFNIQSVTHIPSNKHTVSKTPSELLRDDSSELYTGLPFQQLDEEVQSLLEQYLDVRGINTHLALFVPEYIDVKEQREYLGWLERVRGFVE